MKVDTLYIWILFTVILLFMIFGACIFNYLESDNEAKLKIEYYALFERFQTEHNISDEVIKTFLDVHLKASKLGVPCDGVPCDNVYKWDFIGSFFFSGTILTTIGFGHASPLTTSGQVCCILFALIGIPLNILFMNIILEKSITTSNHIITRLRATTTAVKEGKKDGSLPLIHLSLFFSLLFTATLLLMALIFAFVENWTYFEGLYFVFISFTTIGLGDFVPSAEPSKHNTHYAYKILNWFLIMIGVLVTYMFLNLITILLKALLRKLVSSQKLVSFVDQKPAVQTAVDTARKSRILSERSTLSSLSNFDEHVGAFAIVQSVIDKMRLKAENNSEILPQLEIVERIEEILKKEYLKIQQRNGTSVKSKWRRAAARARIQSTQRKYKKSFHTVFSNNVVTIDIPEIEPPVLCSEVSMEKQRHNMTSEWQSKHSTPVTFTIGEECEIESVPESNCSYLTSPIRKMGMLDYPPSSKSQRASVETQNTDVTYLESYNTLTLQEYSSADEND